MFNNRGSIDTRKALTGKDGALFNDAGVMLATVESYQTQVNVSNTKFQPLGDAQEHEVFQSYSVTLTFTELVIEDEGFISDLIEGLRTGIMPEWSFQGVVQGRNGSEQRMVYRGVVPSGTIDLQNVSVGDLIKRAWSMFVNDPPELQSLLTA